MTGPSIRVPGLPDFNAGDSNFRCTALDGWWGRSTPRAEMVVNGAAAGAVAVGPWDDSEAYFGFRGVIRSTDRAELMTYRRALLNALPAHEEAELVVLGNDEDVDLAVQVRRYDAPDVDVVGNNLIFSIPLVALDPLKYATESQAGAFGAFTGDSWHIMFDVDTAPTPDEWYLAPDVDTAPTPDEWYFAFEQEAQEVEGTLAKYATLSSDGDVASRRVTIDVTGPLTAGDWYLVNETTGDICWVELDLVAGQTIRLDSSTQTATLNGASVDTYVYGDFLTFEPGTNTYRLITGVAVDGFAQIEATPAYR